MLSKLVYLIPILSLLFIAFFYPLPYVFYTLNRIITTFFSVIAAVQTWETKRSFSCAFIFAAILFNPIAPVHFTRAIWKVIDVIAVLPFIMLILLRRR
ncbi:MAG: DUF6804 family protein [Candidatus Cloacimonadia bacterium]